MGRVRAGHFRPPVLRAIPSPSAGDYKPGWSAWAQAEQATSGRLQCGQLRALQPVTTSQAGQRGPRQNRPLQAACFAGNFEPFSRRLQAMLATVGRGRTGHNGPPAMRATTSPSVGNHEPSWPTWAGAGQANAGRLQCGQPQARQREPQASKATTGQRRSRPPQAAHNTGTTKPPGGSRGPGGPHGPTTAAKRQRTAAASSGGGGGAPKPESPEQPRHAKQATPSGRRGTRQGQARTRGRGPTPERREARRQTRRKPGARARDETQPPARTRAKRTTSENRTTTKPRDRHEARPATSRGRGGARGAEGDSQAHSSSTQTRKQQPPRSAAPRRLALRGGGGRARARAPRPLLSAALLSTALRLARRVAAGRATERGRGPRTRQRTNL